VVGFTDTSWNPPEPGEVDAIAILKRILKTASVSSTSDISPFGHFLKTVLFSRKQILYSP
jgi:hypothetical protein